MNFSNIKHVVDKHKGFEIFYESKKNESNDTKLAHIFSAIKPFFLSISIVFYEVSSTKPDITCEEIKEKGLKKIKLMIDREQKYFEELL